MLRRLSNRTPLKPIFSTNKELVTNFTPLITTRLNHSSKKEDENFILYLVFGYLWPFFCVSLFCNGQGRK